MQSFHCLVSHLLSFQNTLEAVPIATSFHNSENIVPRVKVPAIQSLTSQAEVMVLQPMPRKSETHETLLSDGPFRQMSVERNHDGECCHVHQCSTKVVTGMRSSHWLSRLLGRYDVGHSLVEHYSRSPLARLFERCTGLTCANCYTFTAPTHGTLPLLFLPLPFRRSWFCERQG
jgi:hypothetical protein